MTKRVLIVEDNELNMRLFDDLLTATGLETRQMLDGTGIVEVVEEFQPDLIVMDIQLPHRSGVELTKDIKSDARFQDIPIVAVTAFGNQESEQLVRDAGCIDYIQKPISVPVFLESINKHLG